MLEPLICTQCGAPLAHANRCIYCGVRFAEEDLAGQVTRWNGIGSIDENGNVTPWRNILGIESTPGIVSCLFADVMTDEMRGDDIIGRYFVDHPEALHFVSQLAIYDRSMD